MSPDFNLHYDRLRENDPTKPAGAGESSETVSSYDTPGHARNLCLVWPDGKRQFLSYAYLLGGTFDPDENMNVITLNFSAYIVTLSGYGLESLFADLLNQLPKQIMQVERRHSINETIVVIEAKVEIGK